jgi:hypothetical protein
MRPRGRLILAVLAAAPLTARAGEIAQAPSGLGMALTAPDPGMANGSPAPAPTPAAGPPTVPQKTDLTGGQRRLGALGSGLPAADGQLPNQRTGRRREHVVHDICIGC